MALTKVKGSVAEKLNGYADLRLYRGDSDTIELKYRSQLGDGAGGVFVRKGSAVDNDGTVIVDALGRSWERLFTGPVNVKWFGAGAAGNDTAAFQNAARVATSTTGFGTVDVPAGVFYVSKVGIRGTVFRGVNRESTIIMGTGSGSASEFMFDAQLDTDGATSNTAGGGWCESMTIDANGSGRSLIRTYGGGARPTSLVLRNATAVGAIGLSLGLPIWTTVSNVYVTNCDRGIFTFSGPGDVGTSTTFTGCWANGCLTYGFDITQLYYSSFINCVAQDSGVRNWNINGVSNGINVLYSLQLIGCGTEGSGVPFYCKNVRDLTIVNPRIISPTSGIDLLTLDNCSGTITDFSTPSISGGSYHLKVINHDSGPGTIKVLGGNVTYNPADVVASYAISPVGVSYGRLVNTRSGDYTLTLDDAGKQVQHQAGAGPGHTFTIPSYATVAYPVGTEIAFVNRDGNLLSIAITDDTLILANSFSTGTRTLAAQAMAIARKVSPTIWIIADEGGGLS